MPTAPDELIGVVAEADLLADAVEDHLDTYPLPVDDDEVDRIAARLADRIEERAPASRRPWWMALPVAAAAAAALWGLSVGWEWTGAATSSEATDAPAAVLQADTEEATDALSVPVAGGLAGRPILVEGDTTLLTSSAEGVGVLLVQEGEASVDGTVVPAGHWAVVARPEGEVVVFPDGERPPMEPSAPVQEQLRDVRWRSLPPRTHEALDRLLEER